MAITTTDVVTNVVSGVEVPKNATCVVFCQRTGEYESLDSIYDVSMSYDSLENLFTNRFDDVNYYAGGAGA
jgi:hypothetical protein